MDISTKDLSEKIKSIESWEWYFSQNDFDDFYKEFQKLFPDIKLDSNVVKKLGIELAKGKDVSNIPTNLTSEIQGQNVAFKCTWNDKDFAGICSRKVYEYNRQAGRIWCNQSENNCQEITEEEFKNGDIPCYESNILIDYSFSSGIHHIGNKSGEAIALRNVKVGKMALLTTREPEMEEKDRYIFAIFDIENIDDRRYNGKQLEAVKIFGNKHTSIKIDKRIKLKFWDFYRNQNNPDNIQWGTGLFRYISDVIILKLLNNLKEEYVELGDVDEKIKKIEYLIKRYEP